MSTCTDERAWDKIHEALSTEANNQNLKETGFENYRPSKPSLATATHVYKGYTPSSPHETETQTQPTPEQMEWIDPTTHPLRFSLDEGWYTDGSVANGVGGAGWWDARTQTGQVTTSQEGRRT